MNGPELRLTPADPEEGDRERDREKETVETEGERERGREPNKLMLSSTDTTPRTTTKTTPRTPESIVFNQYMRPPKGSIIKLRRDCFKQNRFGNDINAHASKKRKKGLSKL